MTVYFETVATEYLERALYLEAERLAFLPTALDQAKFDTEREVVKNERRQSVDNVPYGLVEETLLAKRLPQGPSLFLVGDRLDEGPERRLARRPQGVLRRVLPSRQRDALPGGRLRPGSGEGPDHAVLRTPLPGQARRAGQGPAGGRHARRDVELADEVKLPRIYWAWPTVADDHPDAPAIDLLCGGPRRRRDLAAVQGPGPRPAAGQGCRRPTATPRRSPGSSSSRPPRPRGSRPTRSRRSSPARSPG